MSKSFALILLCLCTFQPSFSQPQDARGARSTADRSGSARRSFRELIAARDRQILDALKAKDAFICFRENKDEFLVVAFSAPEIWTSDEKTPALENGYSIPLFDDYLNGATAPHGMGIGMPFGKWTRVKGSEEFPTFESTNRKPGQDSDDKGYTYSIDLDEVTVQETYENAAGGTTRYTFNLRRSTGRFTESFNIIPQYGEHELSTSEGHCEVYAKGRAIHH